MSQAAIARIYLGCSFLNEVQRERAKQAREYLAQNPTVEHVHFPFDQQVVDPAESPQVKLGDERSLLWQSQTYQNALAGIQMANCGVFLYDMDLIDDGCAFEIGFMRAQHKPVMLLPFTEEPEKKRVMNLMLAQGATAFYDGNTELEILKTYDFNTNPAKPMTGYGII